MFITRLKLITALCFCIIFSITLNAQLSPLLQKVQNKFNGLQGLQVTFSLVRGGQEVSGGKYFYRAPDKSRVEHKAFTLITDGKTAWNVNRSSRKVVISNYQKDEVSITSLSSFINGYPSQCEVSESMQNNESSLVFVPKKAGLNFREAVCFVDRALMITRIEIEDKSGVKVTLFLKGYKLTPPPAEALFTFTSQAGDKIIDLR
jgi:outer membrane lipoprotein-sorting protein